MAVEILNLRSSQVSGKYMNYGEETSVISVKWIKEILRMLRI